MFKSARLLTATTHSVWIWSRCLSTPVPETSIEEHLTFPVPSCQDRGSTTIGTIATTQSSIGLRGVARLLPTRSEAYTRRSFRPDPRMFTLQSMASPTTGRPRWRQDSGPLFRWIILFGSQGKATCRQASQDSPLRLTRPSTRALAPAPRDAPELPHDRACGSLAKCTTTRGGQMAGPAPGRGCSARRCRTDLGTAYAVSNRTCAAGSPGRDRCAGGGLARHET